MTVVVGRLSDDGEVEHPATLGRLRWRDASNGHEDQTRGHSDLSNSLDGTQVA
jgi:hypothetical protein